MSKIRVYELAQKMGIDNKELMARLKAMGVEVKNHMAVIDEADASKLTAPAKAPATTTAPAKEVKEEVRVTTTLIRRRPKVVEPTPEALAAPEAPPEEKVAVKAEEAAPAKVEEAKAQVKEEAQIPEKAAAARAEEPPAPRPTPTRAVILGRVEIPGARPREARPERREYQQPAPRGTERPAPPRPSERPAPSRPSERPAPPRGAERPVPSRGPARPAAPTPVEVPVMAEDRKKGRKGKEVPVPEVGKGIKKGGAPVDKKKEAFKKAELLEKRERIFEPGPRAGKGRKKERGRAP
jgi:translation initiation factor IF-2